MDGKDEIKPKNNLEPSNDVEMEDGLLLWVVVQIETLAKLRWFASL